ncbi:hypothetical protein CPB85DRAFT_1225975 [Mucidula mucida]|nr:hypothetical protein CPB85DRAFT_1225975 [Mucidula mucida]
METYKSLLDDVRTCLEDNFHLSKQQAVNVCAVIMDIIFAPQCPSALTVHITAEAILLDQKAALLMTNIWGTPAREIKLRSTIKSTASSVRGAFKTDVSEFRSAFC